MLHLNSFTVILRSKSHENGLVLMKLDGFSGYFNVVSVEFFGKRYEVNRRGSVVELNEAKINYCWHEATIFDISVGYLCLLVNFPLRKLVLILVVWFLQSVGFVDSC